MIQFRGQMPPVGTDVGLSLRLPTTRTRVEVQGQVIRVDLVDGDGSASRVGVQFERFSGRGATRLIDYLAHVDDRAKSHDAAPVIAAPPPRVRD